MKRAPLYTGIRVPGTEQEDDRMDAMLDEEAVGEKNGFFKIYHFNVLNALSDGELDEFGALRTDEERLVWLHALGYVHAMPSKMGEIMSREFVKAKSAEAARKRRIEGNRAFQAKDYVSALDLYSEAVIRAPTVHQGTNLFINRHIVCFASLKALV